MLSILILERGNNMKFEGFRSSMEFTDGILHVYRKNIGIQDINITIPLSQINTVGLIKPTLAGNGVIYVLTASSKLGYSALVTRQDALKDSGSIAFTKKQLTDAQSFVNALNAEICK